jgi:hypothetical protein
MNERINELMELSGAWDYFYNGDDKSALMDRKALENFAELIVQECLAECWYDATPKQIADNIRAKFGVAK